MEALGLVALKGKVVTGDALHCNRPDGGCDQRRRRRLVPGPQGQSGVPSVRRPRLFRHGAKQPQAVTTDAGHGRKETRKAVVVSAKALGEYHEFPGLKGFGRIEATRETDGKVTSETRIFALSRVPAPEVVLTTVRDHRAIENALHWQLDASFREDTARNRKNNGPGNIALLRRRALDILRRAPSNGVPLHRARARRLG